jgi:hypothetical protein
MKEYKRGTFVTCFCGDGRVMPLFWIDRRPKKYGKDKDGRSVLLDRRVAEIGLIQMKE